MANNLQSQLVRWWPLWCDRSPQDDSAKMARDQEDNLWKLLITWSFRGSNCFAPCETYWIWRGIVFCALWKVIGFTLWCCFRNKFNFDLEEDFGLVCSLWKLCFHLTGTFADRNDSPLHRAGRRTQVYSLQSNCPNEAGGISDVLIAKITRRRRIFSTAKSKNTQSWQAWVDISHGTETRCVRLQHIYRVWSQS